MSNVPNAAQKKNKNKSPSKKVQKSNRTAFTSQVRPASAFRLSSCGEKYLDSLLDPFEGPADACVPNWPSFPSQKLRAFARGALNIGTAGMGFICVRPCIANDLQIGIRSGSAYAGTTVDTAAGTFAVNSNSTFVNADFGAAGLASMRIVSLGVRVRYTGTELNRGGAIYTLEAPEHQTLIGLDVPGMRSYDACHSFPVDKEWTQVCWVPVQASELEYFQNAMAPNGSGSAAASGYPLAIAIQSTAGNAFEFEVFVNAEVMGANVRSKTKSDTDLTGLSVVTGALRSHNGGAIDRAVVTHRDKRPTKGSSLPGILRTVGKYAWDQLSGFVSDPGNLAKAAGLIAPTILA